MLGHSGWSRFGVCGASFTHAGMSGISHEGSPMAMGAGQAPAPPVPVMTLLSFLVLAAGAAIAFLLQPL